MWREREILNRKSLRAEGDRALNWKWLIIGDD
jgi:hypothetical protein